MNIERERKFLVNPGKLPQLPSGRVIEAGYFTDGPIAIRVTKRDDGVQKVCIKGPGLEMREEFEYSVPAEDAHRLLALAPTYLKKTRYDLDGWEIDQFHSMPLWLAEYEEAVGKAPLREPLPEWVIAEVTKDRAFSNMSLAWAHGRRNSRSLLKRGDTIYVSGPYTKGNVNANVQRAVQVAEGLKDLGLVPFIPHLYHLWDLIQPHDYEYWMDLCLGWVPNCSAIYRIAGESSGAVREVDLAKKLGIPVFNAFDQIHIAMLKENAA